MEYTNDDLKTLKSGSWCWFVTSTYEVVSLRVGNVLMGNKEEMSPFIFLHAEENPQNNEYATENPEGGIALSVFDNEVEALYDSIERLQARKMKNEERLIELGE